MASWACKLVRVKLLTRSEASRTLVPNPKEGSEGLVLLTCDPNPLLSIFVEGSGILGCSSILKPASAACCCGAAHTVLLPLCC